MGTNRREDHATATSAPVILVHGLERGLAGNACSLNTRSTFSTTTMLRPPAGDGEHHGEMVSM